MISIYIFLGITNLIQHTCATPSDASTSQPSPAPSGGVNFIIQNQHPAAVNLNYANGSGVSPLTSPALIANNETLTATFPAGWQGNIQVVEAGHGGDFSQASWIEGNTLQGQVWMDVSYVRGFSVSAVCACAQSDGSQRVSGCNKDLWSSTGKSCPNKGGQANVTCPNTSKEKGPADKWFAPCTHLAYTYPDDIPNYECAPGQPVNCCIGDTCARPPNPPGVGENSGSGRARPDWGLGGMVLVICLVTAFSSPA